MSYVYVFATVFLTVLGQIIVKWQVTAAPKPLDTWTDRVLFLLNLLVNPWIVSSLVAGMLALLCWMLAMTKLDLSHAYPFVSLSFVLVLALSALLFHEPMNWYKIVGVALIVSGVALSSQG